MADEREEDPVDRRFAEIAGSAAELTRSGFLDAMSVHDSHAGRRMFSLFDSDKDGTIGREEFRAVFEKMAHGSEDERLDLVFRLHDTNGDGRLDRKEVERMILAGMTSYSLDLPAPALESLVEALFAEADPERTGAIGREAFTTLVQRFPSVLADLGRSESARALTGSTRSHAGHRRDPWWARAVEGARLHALELAFAGVAFVVLGAVFLAAVAQYAALGAPATVQLARGCGAALELAGAAILLPMLRRSATWLRRRRIGRFLPLDHGVSFHVLLAHVAFWLGLVHTGAHVTNWLSTGGLAALRQGLLGTVAGASGLALLLAFGIMMWFSRPAVRRSGRFETFHGSHRLYFLWFPLMLVHGPTFWVWATAPLAGYVIERILRAHGAARRCELVEERALGSGVSHLVIAAPPEWVHGPGDYVFVRIPAISRHEWHPFTISSAPEHTDRIELHVRSAGNWTRALHRRLGDGSPIGEVHLDGPFGTPSAHIFDTARVVLVGAGIGVTPFAAILDSIHERSADPDGASPVPRSVDFVWLVHDQHAFAWFTERLAALEVERPRTSLHYHLYITGSRVAMTTASLALAHELLHRKAGRDPWTGLAARTQFGHPNWPSLLSDIRTRAGGEPVSVFYCGPLAMVPELRAQCRRLGLSFRHEVF